MEGGGVREALCGEIPAKGREGVEVGLDSDLGGLTMEDQERMAVLNNNLSSSVRMVERRGRGQEGIYRAGMRVSIDTDMSSSLGLQTLYCDLRPCEHDPHSDSRS